jgi:ammonium transporter, Amt family
MAHDMEWVDIVDEQDRVVGRATRAEMRAGNLLHRCVAIFCFDADRRRVYVHRRTAHKDVFPNLYDMSVGGVVRAGEDYASAARREIDEELAIAGPVPELLFRHRYEGSLSRSHTAVYQVSWSGPIRHQASEVRLGRLPHDRRSRAKHARFRVRARRLGNLPALPRAETPRGFKRLTRPGENRRRCFRPPKPTRNRSENTLETVRRYVRPAYRRPCTGQGEDPTGLGRLQRGDSMADTIKLRTKAGSRSRLAPALALFGLIAGAIAGPSGTAFAEDAPADLATRVADLEAYIKNEAPTALVDTPGPGHNGWMMVCAALVLFMTLPGLALFYGGLVRRKNILSVCAQCFGMAGLVPLLWWAFGYSLVFDSGSPFLGGTSFAMFNGVTSAPNTDYGAWVSHNVFATFQMMFAIITPALIVGAVAERMKYSALILFLGLWMVVIYFPMAHMVWGADGFMNGVWNAAASIKAIDFAGGTVVHMTSGWSALVLCIMLGKRAGFGQRAFAPHSLTLTVVGTGMLWVGWYGFNAGSAVAADGVASNAFVTTTLAAAVAAGTWPALEWLTRGQPTVLGFCSGAVGGLVVITPGAGFVSPSAAVLMGVFAGVVPFFACTKLKAALKYDDALDTFGVHGVGGTLGALLTGFFATADVNANLSENLAGLLGSTLWIEQVKAIGVTLIVSVVGTVVIASIVKALVGLRPDAEDEESGLDYTDHGESGYHMDERGGHLEASNARMEEAPAAATATSEG